MTAILQGANAHIYSQHSPSRIRGHRRRRICPFAQSYGISVWQLLQSLPSTIARTLHARTLTAHHPDLLSNITRMLLQIPSLLRDGRVAHNYIRHDPHAGQRILGPAATSCRHHTTDLASLTLFLGSTPSTSSEQSDRLAWPCIYSRLLRL